MAYDIDIAADEFYDGRHSEGSRIGPAPEGGAQSSVTMSPDPNRSMGGFLNYAGWPDGGRFIELDHAIRNAQNQIDEQFESD